MLTLITQVTRTTFAGMSHAQLTPHVPVVNASMANAPWILNQFCLWSYQLSLWQSVSYLCLVFCCVGILDTSKSYLTDNSRTVSFLKSRHRWLPDWQPVITCEGLEPVPKVHRLFLFDWFGNSFQEQFVVIIEGRKHQGALVDVLRLSVNISKCDSFPYSQTHLKSFIRSEPAAPSKHFMKSK